MKKLFFFIIFILVAWAGYYDLTKGTLPTPRQEAHAVTAINSSDNKKEKNNKEKQKEFVTIEIQPGDTVLSIVERVNKDVNVSITKVLADFRSLNPDADPHQINIGETYAFPVYKQ